MGITAGDSLKEALLACVQVGALVPRDVEQEGAAQSLLIG